MCAGDEEQREGDGDGMRDDIKCRGNGSTRARANSRICVVGEKTRPDWVGLLALSRAGGNGIRFYESVNNTSVHRAEQSKPRR